MRRENRRFLLVAQALARNPGFETIFRISEVLRGQIVKEPKTIKACCLSEFKCATITSCDAERSFSACKLILCDKRRQLTLDNIEKIVVTYCDLNYNSLLLCLSNQII